MSTCHMLGRMMVVSLFCMGVDSSFCATVDKPCGQVEAVQATASRVMRYAYSPAAKPAGAEPPITLALLPGGSGRVRLDEQGCASELKGNSLVRSIFVFNALGIGTALIDAPSDHDDEDGLAGFRITPQHAQDLGRVIQDLRRRTQGAVWLVGTSRGSISAANAASRLSGDAVPDGVVLTSVVTSGQSGTRKAWVSQTALDVPLEQLRIPLLLVGHGNDQCVRSPPSGMSKVQSRVASTRSQLVIVAGGVPGEGASSVAACEGRSPHGFLGQEQEVAEGMARFIRGALY